MGEGIQTMTVLPLWLVIEPARGGWQACPPTTAAPLSGAPTVAERAVCVCVSICIYPSVSIFIFNGSRRLLSLFVSIILSPLSVYPSCLPLVSSTSTFLPATSSYPLLRINRSLQPPTSPAPDHIKIVRGVSRQKNIISAEES